MLNITINYIECCTDDRNPNQTTIGKEQKMKKIMIFAAIILVGLALFESEATADPTGIPSDTDTLYRFSFVDVYGTTGGNGVVTGEIYGLHWDSINMQATHILITSSPFTSETIDVIDSGLFPSQGVNNFTTSAGVVIAGEFAAFDIERIGDYGNTLLINFCGLNLFTFGEQYRQYVWGNSGFAAANFVDDPPTAPVPEPTTMLLLGLGVIGITGIRRKLNI
jgi:hypothetical protein